MSGRKELLLLGVFLGCLAGAQALVAADTREELDRKLLQDAGIGTDADGLLAFLRSPAPKDTTPEQVQRLVAQLASEDFEKREQATKELMACGRAVLDPLRKALQSGDPEVVTRARACLRHIETRTGWQMYAAASRRLVWLRPDGVVPKLLDNLGHPDATARRETESALRGLLGPDDLPEVVKAIKDKRPLVRAGAIALSYKFKDQPKVFAPLLLEALRDENVLVRRNAAAFLGQFGPQEGVVAALIEALRDKDETPMSVVSVAAGDADSLARLREQARPAIPALMDLSKTGSKWNRYSAILALGYLGKRDKAVAPTVVPFLVEVFQNKTQAIANRTMAAGALGLIGPDSKTAVPALLGALKGEDAEDPESKSRIRNAVLTALERIGHGAESAVQDLTAVLLDKKQNHEDRQIAADALGAVGPAAKSSIPALTESLKDKDSQVRAAAARALETLRR